MTDIICGYSGDRDETLVAYLYDDIKPAERARFEAHLAVCATCRGEVDALRAVRLQLSRWAPPEPSFQTFAGESSVGRRSSRGLSLSWWREIPTWAQVAAAMLFLGVSLALANLDVHYDRNGLTVRTGWSRGSAPPSSAMVSPPTASSSAAPSAESRFGRTAEGASATSPVTRAELVALEQRLKGEFHARPALSEAELMRRLKVLVDDSERRQQRELALRVAEVVRDVNSQRQADLRRIDQNIGIVQNRTGVEVLRQREMLNYIVQRVSQRP